MRNVMLQNSINLMVQPEFSPVNCPLSSAFANICQNLSFESLLPKVSLVSKVSKQSFVFGHFWLFSQNNQPTLDWKFKNKWTKRLQKIPRKLNLSLSLAKRKLAEKMNRICLTNEVRSCMLQYTSQIAEEASFFSVTLFREWFYDKKLQSFISQFNQFHPECYYHKASLDGYFWIYV